MINDPWDLITLIALIVTLVADVFFVISMHVFVPWRTNAWGKHVMTFSYVLAIILILSFARLIFGEYPFRRQILTAFYVALAWVMIQRVWLTWKMHFFTNRGAEGVDEGILERRR